MKSVEKTVTIKHAAFTYQEDVPDPIRPGQTIIAQRVAFQGQTITLTHPEDYVLGEQHHAFVREGEQVPNAAGRAFFAPDSSR